MLAESMFTGGIELTILDPGITQCVDTLRLVLANDDIPDGSPRHKVEDSIGIGSLSLLVTAAFDTLVALHLPIKGLTRVDVHGLIEDNSLLRDWELNTRKGETRCWAATKIALCGISRTLSTIALLVLAAINRCCRGQSRDEGKDESRSELHCDG